MKIADGERRSKGPARPSQERPEAGSQFLHGQWLEYIVVGACVEGRDPIVNVITCGQDEDRRAGVAAAQFPQHVYPIAIRETEVEDNSRIRDCPHSAESVCLVGKEINPESEIT